MAHECDDCGGRFETLSRLRLHDCADEDAATEDGTSNGSTDGEWLEGRGKERRRERERLAARTVDDEFDREFSVTLEDAVERQLREAVAETGYADRLPDDWTFADLEFRW